MTITLATGAEIQNVNTCTVSPMSGALVVHVEQVSMAGISGLMTLLDDGAATAVITTHGEGMTDRSFEGYTHVTNLNFNADNRTLTAFLARG